MLSLRKRFLWEDLAYWGNDSICEDCLDDVTSRYNREENDRETQEAYEEMRKRYVGRKVLNPEKVDRVIEHETEDIGTMYQLTVELDENGVLTELSRLSAYLFLNRAEEVIKRRPYPIQNADYETIVDAMLEDYEFEDQPEK